MCKRCTNPNGVRPVTVVSTPKTVKRRIRDRYDTQEFELKGRKTAKFMRGIGETVTEGSLSQFEYLLISAIIQNCHADIQDWDDIERIDPHFVGKNFRAVKSLAHMMNLKLPIFNRSNMDIKNAMKYYQSQFEIFYKLHT